MKFPIVSIINESSVVSDDEVATIADALEAQVRYDFLPHWDAGARIRAIPKGGTPIAGSWWLVFLDNSDQAGALGYHDLTSDLLPIGKIFAKTDQTYGLKPSVTASHELLEMLGDPYINLTAIDTRTSRAYAYETADAVEADGLGYDINGVTVSDFVLPNFFSPEAYGKTGPFSFKNHITKPFSLAKGGYLSYLDLSDPSAGWQQVTAEEAPDGSRAPGFPKGSRRERRTRLHELKASEHKNSVG